LKGKRELKPVVYEFLRNDGFPVNYGSVVARINELAKDGLLIREETGAPVAEAELNLEGWIDLTGEVPHMGTPVRRLPLKDQILLTYFAMGLKGKREMKPVEVYEFLRNDGFPVNYGSVVARINELAKDGLLIREETGTYRISRFGEDRVRSILTSSTPG
jgi:aldehyde:ferredoxin oxidoreductase